MHATKNEKFNVNEEFHFKDVKNDATDDHNNKKVNVEVEIKEEQINDEFEFAGQMQSTIASKKINDYMEYGDTKL